ncbi:tRNA adenosine(34) deaminase TadA [Marinibactrum halimedae]|uniref:tRNA-specific adenosine deaminase n=1 Tax=Marinibactrum halimedae TaxID=1444977 RepID=A0AA37WQ23_9GAMM|nr:tRNA adenosine(34) deaminase TadA [Marinibactrum halimedae]MCD9459375.1 tRNA adenosine(34) deaminase TadA [Marinibactrum halimedae]GLS27561.1 tRNA-specific adenosine deaminase [Marinibactrum halimedae]
MSDLPEDERWMRYALALSERARDAGEVPVAAVIVQKGEVIGEGWNQPISGCDPTAHAEVIALRAAAKKVSNYRLPECDMYVTIEPCTMCVGAIIHARIRRLVFGAFEPKAGAVVSQLQLCEQPLYNHRVEVTSGVLAQECSQAISDFFKARRAEKKALKHR